MAGVRTGVHVFAICVKTGIIFKMRNTSFFHVSVPNITAPVHHLFDNNSEGDIKGFVFQHILIY
jgi:hypothetical protein